MKILLPVDGSPLSLAAVDQAIRLVRDGLRATCVLANVQEPSSLYEMVVVHDPEALRRMATQAGEHALAEAVALLTRADIGHEIDVVAGEPAHALMELLENYGCDLVICGARGLGESGAPVGSVAQELLRHASVPVMLVRPPEPVPEEGTEDTGPASLPPEPVA